MGNHHLAGHTPDDKQWSQHTGMKEDGTDLHLVALAPNADLLVQARPFSPAVALVTLRRSRM